MLGQRGKLCTSRREGFKEEVTAAMGLERYPVALAVASAQAEAW